MWVRIKNFLKMNTPGQADGKFRLWVNDASRISKDGLGNFRTSLHGFDRVAFGGWHSGPAGDNPSVAATYWIDNPRISLKDDFASWPESRSVTILGSAPRRTIEKGAARNRPLLFGEDRNHGNGYDSRGRLHKLK